MPSVDREDLAFYFDEDSYVGSDMRRVLQNPHHVPVGEPDRVTYTTAHFIGQMESYLGKDFSKEHSWMIYLTAEMSGKDRPYPMLQEKSILHRIYTCNRQEYFLPKIAEKLEADGLANMAAIATAFAEQMEVLSEDIMRRALIIYTFANKKPRPRPNNSLRL